MRKLELVKQFRMEHENPFVAAHKRAYPHTRLTIFQMELIEATVTDEKAWDKTILFWAGNAYRGESVFKMLDYYRQVVAGTVQTFERADTSKASQVGRAIEPPQPVRVKCSTCYDEGNVWGTGGMVPCPKCREAA